MDLDRFVTAQDPIWADVLAELRTGAKRSHWMWFAFPQVAGLGRSSTAQYYADPEQPRYPAVLAHWFDGAPDPRTLELLDPRRAA